MPGEPVLRHYLLPDSFSMMFLEDETGGRSAGAWSLGSREHEGSLGGVYWAYGIVLFIFVILIFMFF